ncbi:MAG: hypothetical protein ACYDH6_15115 [Acidimicrobiales bacterium]
MLDARTCLICSTLGATTVTATPPTTAPSAVPGGRVEVMGQRSHHLGLVGWLAVLIALALVGWWILGLIWAVLRIVELVAVGLVCGYVGFKLGVIAGRHQHH